MEESPSSSQTTTVVNPPHIPDEPEAGTSKITPTPKKQEKKKKSVRMKERKILENYRLRKLCTPKSASMAFKPNFKPGELKGVNMTGFTTNQISNPGPPSFLCEATIDGVAYKSIGRSKKAAETNVYDQAIKDVMVKKIKATEKAQEENVTLSPEEEVPVVSLVSYAIHKLFADWESEGYCLKCGGSKSKDPTDKCTCPSDSPHYGLQEALAQITAPIPKDVEVKDEDVSDSDVEGEQNYD